MNVPITYTGYKIILFYLKKKTHILPVIYYIYLDLFTKLRFMRYICPHYFAKKNLPL